MSAPAGEVTIKFRIPGLWTHPQELADALPADHRLMPDSLILPDLTEIGFGAARADTEFAGIFRNSCRQEPSEDELAKVDRYRVNVFLMGPGGSLEAARKMMEAASAIVRAGGAGVFIDNCGLAHGGQNWLEMTDDGGPDAISFAFVSIMRGKLDVTTMGMHCLGLRDIVMKREDVEGGGFDIVEVIRYLARGDKPVDEGHLIADLDGPRFRVSLIDSDKRFAGSPMDNPYGRLKLVSMRDIAESN